MNKIETIKQALALSNIKYFYYVMPPLTYGSKNIQINQQQRYIIQTSSNCEDIFKSLGISFEEQKLEGVGLAGPAKHYYYFIEDKDD